MLGSPHGEHGGPGVAHERPAAALGPGEAAAQAEGPGRADRAEGGTQEAGSQSGTTLKECDGTNLNFMLFCI